MGKFWRDRGLGAGDRQSRGGVKIGTRKNCEEQLHAQAWMAWMAWMGYAEKHNAMHVIGLHENGE